MATLLPVSRGGQLLWLLLYFQETEPLWKWCVVWNKRTCRSEANSFLSEKTFIDKEAKTFCQLLSMHVYPFPLYTSLVWIVIFFFFGNWIALVGSFNGMSWSVFKKDGKVKDHIVMSDKVRFSMLHHSHGFRLERAKERVMEISLKHIKVTQF